MIALFLMTTMIRALAASASSVKSAHGGGFLARAVAAGRGEMADSGASQTKAGARGVKGVAEAALIECEIERHLEAIALYEQGATSPDAQVRVFAQRILPQLHRNLALLRSLKPGR